MSIVCQLLSGFEEEIFRGSPTGSAEVSISNANFAQVLVARGITAGLTPSPTWGSRLGRPSEIQNLRTRSPYFPIPTPMSSGISQQAHGAGSFQVSYCSDGKSRPTLALADLLEGHRTQNTSSYQSYILLLCACSDLLSSHSSVSQSAPHYVYVQPPARTRSVYVTVALLVKLPPFRGLCDGRARPSPCIEN